MWGKYFTAFFIVASIHCTWFEVIFPLKLRVNILKYDRRDCRIEKKIKKKNIRWIQIWHVECSLWIGKLKQKRKLFGFMISMSTLWIPGEHLKKFQLKLFVFLMHRSHFSFNSVVWVFQSGYSIVKNWLEFIFIEFSNDYAQYFTITQIRWQYKICDEIYNWIMVLNWYFI